MYVTGTVLYPGAVLVSHNTQHFGEYEHIEFIHNAEKRQGVGRVDGLNEIWWIQQYASNRAFRLIFWAHHRFKLI